LVVMISLDLALKSVVEGFRVCASKPVTTV
jgi:hypothetical protein